MSTDSNNIFKKDVLGPNFSTRARHIYDRNDRKVEIGDWVAIYVSHNVYIGKVKDIRVRAYRQTQAKDLKNVKFTINVEHPDLPKMAVIKSLRTFIKIEKPSWE